MGGGSTPGPGIWTLAAFLITTSASILPSEAFATYAPLVPLSSHCCRIPEDRCTPARARTPNPRAGTASPRSSLKAGSQSVPLE